MHFFNHGCQHLRKSRSWCNGCSACIERPYTAREDPVGRQILREQPRVTSASLDLDALARLPEGSLGRAYVCFLRAHGVSPDTRCQVHYVDGELGYVMQRYREVHDMWHTLLGLPITVAAELTVKVVEYQQTRLPMTLLSAVVGPLRLPPQERAHW
eukprot:Colp12_sorted_trinity150504_noHs@28255